MSRRDLTDAPVTDGRQSGRGFAITRRIEARRGVVLPVWTDPGQQVLLTRSLAGQLPEDRVRGWLATGMHGGWRQTLARIDDAVLALAG